MPLTVIKNYWVCCDFTVVVSAEAQHHVSVGTYHSNNNVILHKDVSWVTTLRLVGLIGTLRQLVDFEGLGPHPAFITTVRIVFVDFGENSGSE